MDVTTTEGTTVTVTVDKNLCASSGACIFSAPELFEFDDDEESNVIEGAPPIGTARLNDIVFNCPAGAISVTER
jgi:ferredoxin